MQEAVEGREVGPGFAVGQSIGSFGACICLHLLHSTIGVGRRVAPIPSGSPGPLCHPICPSMSSLQPIPGHSWITGINGDWICPTARESVGTSPWHIYYLVYCGFMVVFFFKRNKSRKQESQKSLPFWSGDTITAGHHGSPWWWWFAWEPGDLCNEKHNSCKDHC